MSDIKINELITNIDNLNYEIEIGEKENPAKIVGDSVVVAASYLSREDKQEIIEIINDWMHEKEIKRIKEIVSDRNKKIKELKELLNENYK